MDELAGRSRKLGIDLQQLSWIQAETILNAEAIVVIPLGAAAKEHGPHLPLNNDLVLAQYLTEELMYRKEVVVAPAVNYFYYPAFIEYPGSVTLRRETAASIIVDICCSLHKFGPRKFYVLNTGISTIAPLSDAAAMLQKEGLLLTYLNMHDAFAQLPADLTKQEGGSHADEIETSMMLAINSSLVNMNLAAKDYYPGAVGRLTRSRDTGFSYSPSGVWGDARLASREKGITILSCLMDCVLSDIDILQTSSIESTNHAQLS